MTHSGRPLHGPYLMEYDEGIAWVARRRPPSRAARILALPLVLPFVAIDGYFSEFAHLLSAGPIESPA